MKIFPPFRALSRPTVNFILFKYQQSQTVGNEDRESLSSVRRVVNDIDAFLVVCYTDSPVCKVGIANERCHEFHST